MKMLSPLAIVAALVVAASAAPAQQDPPQAQTPVFRSDVSLVRVDVSVMGRDGRALAGLQASDFEIDEDGVPQEVETVQFVTLDGTRTDADDSLAIRSPEHAAVEAAREDVRLFAIFLDDYHVDYNVEHASRAKRTLRQFIRQLGPNDLTAIMDPVTPLSALRFTRARDDLEVLINRFEGRLNGFQLPRNAAEEEQRGRRNSGEIRVSVTLSALEALVSHLGGLREGRKSVLLVSQGPPTYPGDPNEARVRQVLQAANRGNVTIHVYDPQPASFAGSRQRDVLERLQRETGGRQFFNSDGTAEQLRQVIADASAYYLVGYTPTRTVADGEFHRIDVRVKREDVRVLARSGYWAPPPVEASPAPPPAPDPAVSTALRALIAPAGGRAVDVWIGASPGPGELTRLTVSWDPAEGSATRRATRLSVELLDPATQTPIGEAQTIASAAVAAGTPSTATLDLPAGTPVLLRFVATASNGEGLDRWTQPVTPATFMPGTLSLGTPRVLRAQSAFEARTLTAPGGRAPSAARRFRQSDRVVVDVDWFAAPGQTPGFAAHVLNARGEPVVELPVAPVSAGQVRVTLPVSSLAPSTYILRLTARAGDRVVEEQIAFLVAP